MRNYILINNEYLILKTFLVYFPNIIFHLCKEMKASSKNLQIQEVLVLEKINGV